ncbi:hypothetical protein C8Q80DRAFT_760019 [Daedaleopsis nitida]|nr:hypothetical protein C8Q80DRAFT_760019 [Daedaleopsis nitida]
MRHTLLASIPSRLYAISSVPRSLLRTKPPMTTSLGTQFPFAYTALQTARDDVDLIMGAHPMQWANELLTNITDEQLLCEMIRRRNALARLLILHEAFISTPYSSYQPLYSSPLFAAPVPAQSYPRAHQWGGPTYNPFDTLVTGMQNVSIAGTSEDYTSLDDERLATPGQLSADVNANIAWPGSANYAQDQGTLGIPPPSLSVDDPVNTSQGIDHSLLAPTPYSSDPLPYPASTTSRTFEYLEQGTYQSKQPVGRVSAGPIYFNGLHGVLLAGLDSLASGDAPAFPGTACIGVKASIRFQFTQFPTYSAQARIRHGVKGRDGRPFTSREMGELVFKELKKLMDHASETGRPLLHKGGVVDLNRVLLLRIEHVSNGSLQAILGIRCAG